MICWCCAEGDYFQETHVLPEFFDDYYNEHKSAPYDVVRWRSVSPMYSWSPTHLIRP